MAPRIVDISCCFNLLTYQNLYLRQKKSSRNLLCQIKIFKDSKMASAFGILCIMILVRPFFTFWIKYGCTDLFYYAKKERVGVVYHSLTFFHEINTIVHWGFFFMKLISRKFPFQVLIVFYFAFHAFLNWRHGARGIELIPHREFFMSCPGKCANGCAVSYKRKFLKKFQIF